MSMHFLRHCFCIALLAASAAASAQRAVPVDRIVAVVNDEVITLSEVEGRVAQLSRQLQRQGVALPAPEQMRSQVLERLINDRVQAQEARNLGIRVDEANLQRALQTIADNNKIPLGELRRAVERDEGISWDRFRDDIRMEILLARLRQSQVDNRVTVSEAEVDAFLASPEAAERGREYLVSHILFRAPEGARPQQWEALGRRADEVMRRIRQGEDFGKLAAAFSDAQDAMQGGSLDWRSLERLPAIFAEELPNMKGAQVSRILRSPAGLHIFRIVGQRDASQKLQTAEQTRARHILLRTTEGLGEAEIRRRLTDLRERLRNGTDFAELARLHSSDITSAKGGDLGWLSQGETVPEFERAMNALKPGEISEPVQSPFGWHLIQVVERRTVDVTAERLRGQARDALRDRKADEAYEDWLRQLRDRAYVDVRLDER